MRLITLFTLLSCSYVLALPTTPLEARSVTVLDAATINYFKPISYIAGAAHCESKYTSNWSCGLNCDKTRGFITTATGGNGVTSQYWFVGFYPPLSSVVVAHQGTDLTKIPPLLTDANIIRRKLDSSLFPGVPSSVKVHDGFADNQAKVATQILSAVKTTLGTYGVNNVILTGHSLGGALALLDSIYLPLHLPSVNFRTVTFGMPRVGNQAFADYVDAHVPNLQHINNKDDIVPILPGRFFGFRHPSGEIHIRDDNSWVACSGQENESSGCTIKEVGNIFKSDPWDHVGPYNGVYIQCSAP